MSDANNERKFLEQAAQRSVTEATDLATRSVLALATAAGKFAAAGLTDDVRAVGRWLGKASELLEELEELERAVEAPSNCSVGQG